MTELERVARYGSPTKEDTWVIAQYGRPKTKAGFRLAEVLEARRAFQGEASWKRS